jgi:hypothetical protein
MPRKQALLEVGVRPRPRYYFAEGGLCFIAHRTLLRKENENQKSTSRLHCNRDSPYEVLPTQKSVPRIGITRNLLTTDEGSTPVGPFFEHRFDRSIERPKHSATLFTRSKIRTFHYATSWKTRPSYRNSGHGCKTKTCY